MADLTPNLRASELAVRTTPRRLRPPMMTGFPASAGSSRISIEA
jgi:hypothetical protein